MGVIKGDSPRCELQNGDDIIMEMQKFIHMRDILIYDGKWNTIIQHQSSERFFGKSKTRCFKTGKYSLETKKRVLNCDVKSILLTEFFTFSSQLIWRLEATEMGFIKRMRIAPHMLYINKEDVLMKMKTKTMSIHKKWKSKFWDIIRRNRLGD